MVPFDSIFDSSFCCSLYCEFIYLGKNKRCESVRLIVRVFVVHFTVHFFFKLLLVKNKRCIHSIALLSMGNDHPHMRFVSIGKTTWPWCDPTGQETAKMWIAIITSNWSFCTVNNSQYVYYSKSSWVYNFHFKFAMVCYIM